MQLRPYQEEAIVAIWNEIIRQQTALVCLSTGAGKSILIYELLKKSIALKPDIKCLVLFNRITLLSQLSQRFKQYLGEDKIGIYCGTEGQWDLSKAVTVASIQSLAPEEQQFNLIIVDECHAISEEKGRYEKFIRHQVEKNQKTKVVGFTATPFRSNGYIYGSGKVFTNPCYERGLKYFIDLGFLVHPIAKQPDHQIDLTKLRIQKGEYRQDDIDDQTLNIDMARRQTDDAIGRAIGRRKIVWFCSSIKHAELIKDLLLQKGEDAISLHSKMEWKERDHAQNEFENGKARHLTFVSIVSEGYDYPPIDCIVLMRPTRSAGLMVQTCGRGLRPSPGKSDCLILDYGNVISSLGPLEDPVIGKKRKPGLVLEAPRQKTCPECRTYVAINATQCSVCGFLWQREEATKLNLTADEEASFLKKEKREMIVKTVRLTLHTSKAGNLTYKISYDPPEFFAPSVDEYFTIDSEWGYRKFQLRTIELGIPLKQDPKEQVLQPITKKPTSIQYVLENKYPRVKALIFQEDINRRLQETSCHGLT